MSNPCYEGFAFVHLHESNLSRCSKDNWSRRRLSSHLRVHLHWAKANAKTIFLWSVNMNLDSVLTCVEAMSLSLSYKYKRTLSFRFRVNELNIRTCWWWSGCVLRSHRSPDLLLPAPLTFCHQPWSICVIHFMGLNAFLSSPSEHGMRNTQRWSLHAT